MRLYLLPISTRRTLLYSKRINKQLNTHKPSILDRITDRASTTWVKWEDAGSGWKHKVVKYGNKLFERIPFEEWGLKSIPPLSARRKADEMQGKEKVEVVFPDNVIEKGIVNDVLRKLASERQGLHKKKMIWSIVAMPFTLPVGLIPIVPNLPFFYLAFRAWSHWRALNGSKHIEFLLQNNLITWTPSAELSRVYSRALLWASAKRLDPTALKQYVKITFTVDEEKEEEIQLLEQANGRAVAKVLKMPELAVELDRAVMQVELSVKSKRESKGEKQELEPAREESEEQAQAVKTAAPPKKPKPVSKRPQVMQQRVVKDRPKR